MLNVLQELQVFSAPKTIQKNNKKAFNSPPNNPLQCLSMKQSRSRNESWGTKPPKLIWTLWCTDHFKTCPPHPNRGGGGGGGGRRGKRQKAAKTGEWPIFEKALFSLNCFLPLSSSKTASASCLHHPGGGAIALPTAAKPRQKAAIEDFPERPAQFQIKRRIAPPRAISGWDQTRRHVPQVFLQHSKRELTRAINCSEQLVPETLLLLRCCQGPFLLGLCTMPIPPV